MEGENVRVRDRVELFLDGRQIASVVVGALVLLGVVFVLGLNVGRQLAVKQLEASRGDSLAALDQPPRAAAPPADGLTFHDRLTRDRLPQADPPAPAPPAPLAVAAAVDPSPRPSPARADPRPAARPEAKPETRPEPVGASAARGSYTVQVISTSSRSEADRLAAKLKEHSPRVEEAEVAGKGRLYRVRVGAFGSKPEAEKFLKGLAPRIGTKGLVVASR